MEAKPAEDKTRGRRKVYSCQILTRCTAAERRQIHENARRANRSASRFLVELGTLEAGRLLAPGASAEELAVLEALMYELHKVGVNLTQLAHRENSTAVGGPADPPTDAEIQETTTEVRALLGQIRARLR